MAVDASELEIHRAHLTGHCYRMLGSPFDAEDAVQEAMVRAWRSLDRFDGRSSLRTWLYRIATNVCLDTLSHRARRHHPVDEPYEGSDEGTLEARPRTHWLEPIADVAAIPATADPHEQTVLRQSIRLAFVAALQHLPPRQRAALLLTEVLGWSAAEVAACLETSPAAVNSALQRARATMAALDDRVPSAPLSSADEDLLGRYVDAFEGYDIDRLVSLLRDDATLSMPPYTLWLRGPDPIRRWLLGPGRPCRGSRMVPVQTNGTRGFAQYRRNPEGEGYHAWALNLLESRAGAITDWVSFLDVERWFPMVGLPLHLTTRDAPVGVGR